MRIFLLFFCFPLIVSAQDLRVFSWNTFLIPPPWNITKQTERAHIMMEELPKLNYDIMFFQEAFYDKHRKKMIQTLKRTHPFSAVPKKGKKLKHFQDSGLFIVSKHPLKVLDQVIFNDCAKADCMSSKSAILVEVTLENGKKAQMINTHMQAEDEKKTVRIRKKQFMQIKEMMARHAKPGVPQILVGDLNVDGHSTTEYPESLKFMEMTSAPLEGNLTSTNGFSTDGCYKKPGKEGKPQWLDHIWLKTNGSTAHVHQKKVVPLMGVLDDCGECPLSDHHGVEALVSL